MIQIVPFVERISLRKVLSLFAIHIVFAAVAFAGQRNEIRTLSLCDALANLSSLKGTEVAVRGEWVTSEHGQWVRAPGNGCSEKLVTKGFVWPSAIHLVEDHFTRLDFDSLASKELKIEQAQGRGEPFTVFVTFVGRLETRVPLQVAHYANGTVTGYGFGHLDMSPAELRYTAVRDVVIQRREQPSVGRQK